MFKCLYYPRSAWISFLLPFNWWFSLYVVFVLSINIFSLFIFLYFNFLWYGLDFRSIGIWPYFWNYFTSHYFTLYHIIKSGIYNCSYFKRNCMYLSNYYQNRLTKSRKHLFYTTENSYKNNAGDKNEKLIITHTCLIQIPW